MGGNQMARFWQNGIVKYYQPVREHGFYMTGNSHDVKLGAAGV